MLTDATNVVRFPVERRTTLGLLRAIAPDVREVSLLAETFDIALSSDLQDQTDREAAEYILNQVPLTGPKRDGLLREMLDHAVSTAVAAVRASQSLAQTASQVQQDLAAAQAGPGYWLQDLEVSACECSFDAADALVAAHGRTLEACGVARAVELAMQGEPWTPRDPHAEMNWLLEAQAKRQAG